MKEKGLRSHFIGEYRIFRTTRRTYNPSIFLKIYSATYVFILVVLIRTLVSYKAAALDGYRSQEPRGVTRYTVSV